MYTITFNSHFPLSNYHFQSAVISPCSYASFYSFRDIFLIFFFLPWHKMDWDSCSCQSSKMDFFKNGSIGILNKISCIQICLKKCHIYLHTFGMLVIWISLKGISWELLEQMCICLYHWLWSHQHQLHLCKVKLKTMYMCNYVKFTVKLINSYQKKYLKKK